MKNIEEMKENAFKAKELVQRGLITYDEAKTRIIPWLNAFNKVAKEKAKKFGIKAYSVTFSSFIR